MKVTIELPEDISAALKSRWDDVRRRSLEAIPMRYTEADLEEDLRTQRELGVLRAAAELGLVNVANVLLG